MPEYVPGDPEDDRRHAAKLARAAMWRDDGAAERQKRFAIEDGGSEGRDWDHIEFVGADVAIEASLTGRGLIVDVRGQAAYDLEHIPGSIGRDKNDAEGLRTLPPDQALYLYCT